MRGDPANPHRQATLLKLDTFAELHALAPANEIAEARARHELNLLSLHGEPIAARISSVTLPRREQPMMSSQEREKRIVGLLNEALKETFALLEQR